MTLEEGAKADPCFAAKSPAGAGLETCGLSFLILVFQRVSN
jgi:hypothetical protein